MGDVCEPHGVPLDWCRWCHAERVKKLLDALQRVADAARELDWYQHPMLGWKVGVSNHDRQDGLDELHAALQLLDESRARGEGNSNG